MVLNGINQTNGFQNRFEFLNREKESTFNLNAIRLGARMYNPTIGRFDRVDPVTEEQEQYSLYQYGWNNPVRFSDPDGLIPKPTPYEKLISWTQDLLSGNESKRSNAIQTAVNNIPGMQALKMVVKMGQGEDISIRERIAGNIDYASLALGVTALEFSGAKGGLVAEVGEIEQSVNKTSVAVDAPKLPDAKALLKQGRSGKQERLKEIANDPKASSADRGWIKQDMNEINKGKRKNIRNPPGKDLAHERGREAAKGYSYKHSNLQDRDLHRRQHKYDNNGKSNKERPN